MFRELKELLGELSAAVDADPDRAANAQKTRDAASELAKILPLIHRTGDPRRAANWQELWKEKKLRASDKITDEEKSNGERNSVYFFFGSVAFPSGPVAFAFDNTLTNQQSGGFSPFDSGALAKGYFRSTESNSEWGLAERTTCLTRYSGGAHDTVDFAKKYLSAHFRVPEHYVERSQISRPDFTPYHKLESVTDDRRAWTIEVRLHGDVELSESRGLKRIFLNRSLSFDVPDELLELVCLTTIEEGEEARDDLAERAASWILEILDETRSL